MTTITGNMLIARTSSNTALLSRISSIYLSFWSAAANRALLLDLAKCQDEILANIGLTRRDIEKALSNPQSDEAATTLMRARMSPFKARG